MVASLTETSSTPTLETCGRDKYPGHFEQKCVPSFERPRKGNGLCESPDLCTMRNSGSPAKTAWVAIVVLLCLTSGLFLAIPTHVVLADAHTVPDVQGTVTSSPASGPVSAIIAVNGSGWQGVADGTSVTFGYGADASCASYTPVADSQPGTMNGGGFSGWFRWPPTALGTYTVCAAIGSSILVPANTYTVLSTSQPQTSISASTLTVGQQATVIGSDYLPGGSTVQLVLQSGSGGNAVSLGSVLSNTDGSFSKTFTVPANPTGSDMILATVGEGWPPTLSSSVTFTVNKLLPTPTVTPGSTPQVASTATPIKTAQTTPTVRPAGSTGTPAATPGAGQTPIPTSSANSSQGNTGATATDGSTDLQFPLIAMGVVVLLSVVVLVVVLVVRRSGRSPRRGNPGWPSPSMAEMMPVANGPSPWSEVQADMTGSPISWDTPIPAMNDGQMTPISLGAISMSVNPFVAGYPQDRSIELAAGTRETPEMSVDVWDGMPASTLSQPIDQVPLQSELSANPAIDPFLEAMMRQAQAGLFVLPTQRKEPI